MQSDPAREKYDKQELYRDARFHGQYDAIWQSVDKCVFCDLREKYIFFEENGMVMTISLFAYIDGHFMIVPRRHVTSANELSRPEWETVRKFTYIARKIFKNVHDVDSMQLMQKDGANAQSTVPHLHFHCIPFDAPDLCQWNYRQLSNTPLENVELYKSARKNIIKNSAKFDTKYTDSTVLPIACDLILINTREEILFQQRKPRSRLHPDYLTLPGGGVENAEYGLEYELAREVEEETGYRISMDEVRLARSAVTRVERRRYIPHLNASYKSPSTLLLNTYVLQGCEPDIELEPGDDCQSLHWIARTEVAEHPRISEHTKTTIAELQV